MFFTLTWLNRECGSDIKCCKSFLLRIKTWFHEDMGTEWERMELCRWRKTNDERIHHRIAKDFQRNSCTREVRKWWHWWMSDTLVFGFLVNLFAVNAGWTLLLKLWNNGGLHIKKIEEKNNVIHTHSHHCHLRKHTQQLKYTPCGYFLYQFVQFFFEKT